MCPRRASACHKVGFLALFYAVAYLVMSIVLHQEPVYNFVSEDFSVGDKYVLMFLSSDVASLAGVSGANLFHPRCGLCYLTNNKGFLPLSVYDAILVSDRTNLDTGTYSGKRYLLETTDVCLKKRLNKCRQRPRIASLDGAEVYDLCGLCRHLHTKRDKPARKKSDSEKK